MTRRLLAAALALVAAPLAAEPLDLPGYDRIDVPAAHRAGLVAGSVWYPAGGRTYAGLLGDNAVFEGSRALVGAAPADGPFPLVLLSHGSGGAMDTISWLSSALAMRGAMVLAVNHPGSTSGDSSPRRSIRLGDRAADLSAALDALLADPAFGPRVDLSRVLAAGFSLGGATALNLGGARMDRAAYAAYCARKPEAADCVFFAKGGVDLSLLPPEWEDDMRDPRVTAVAAVDPGMSYGFTPESVAAMALPVQIVSLGDATLLQAADVGESGSGLMARLPDARRDVIAPAHHFTFLAVCKPQGAEILREERDDPVCDDPEGTDRAAVHAEIVDILARFIGLDPAAL